MTTSENVWIEWNGGECPVPLDTIVHVKFRYNDTPARKPRHAHIYNWGHQNSGGDIIAYRLVVSTSTHEGDTK